MAGDVSKLKTEPFAGGLPKKKLDRPLSSKNRVTAEPARKTVAVSVSKQIASKRVVPMSPKMGKEKLEVHVAETRADAS